MLMIVSKLLPAVSMVLGVLTNGVNRYQTVLPIGVPKQRGGAVGSPGSVVALVVSIGGNDVGSPVTGIAAAKLSLAGGGGPVRKLTTRLPNAPSRPPT